MIYVAMAGLTLVTGLSIYQSWKIKRLVAALAATNTSLNETRTLVATHEKKLKQVIKSLA